ncbi:MAG: threonine/serine dehydratase [Alphaproteobacteria bacterium]|nr:threonine/serine dehydratase [Alphaproteobacteria bacterium]
MSSSAPSDPASPVAPPTIADIRDAASRLEGLAVRTPLLEMPALSERLGGRIVVKAEALQRTGAFKFRGAYNRISRLDPAERAAGVVTFSSGNHGQAVAAVARLFGIAATIVMPTDAPRLKVEATRRHGATIVHYDRVKEDREAIARRLVAERHAVLIPPYDDVHIIAGQGTVGLEIAEEAGRRGLVLDAVLVPCGGGGLISGTATAIKALSPTTAVYAVEPADFDDTARSFASGRRETVRPGGTSICDSLLVSTPGAITFAINRRLLSGVHTVTDREAMAAMAVAFREAKLVVEPGGAVALAAVVAGKVAVAGKTVAVVCSGGNVDADAYAAALSS